MKLAEFYKIGTPVISFELFPPRTARSLSELEERLPELISLNPSFMTVTYGALGSTRDRTLEIASMLKNVYGMETAHHLTCVGATKADITEILTKMQHHNIENVVALRGDPPQENGIFIPEENGLSHGNQLVQHIREFADFGIAVAGYPEKHIEANDYKTDLQYLKFKVDSGAEVIITQLFYDNHHFYRFVEDCRAVGITQPIVAGLMPILNFQQIKRITKMCGATIPPKLLKDLEDAGQDDEAVHRIGIIHTSNQALDLLSRGVVGIHFYVLNRHFHIAEIMNRIKGSL